MAALLKFYDASSRRFGFGAAKILQNCHGGNVRVASSSMFMAAAWRMRLLCRHRRWVFLLFLQFASLQSPAGVVRLAQERDRVLKDLKCGQ